mgnify:CR=1 FL=1
MILLQSCGGGSGSTPASNPNPTSALKFLTQPDTWIKQGQSFEYFPSISGNTSSPDFELTSAPAGMVIDSASGRVFWTPQTNQTGVHQISLKATADSSSGIQLLSLTVSGSVLLLEQVIPTSGGSLSASGISLTIPNAAVAENTSFKIQQISGSPNYEERTAIKAFGNIYSITATDLSGNPVQQFGAPLTITIDYNPDLLPADVNESELSAFLVDTDLQSVLVHAESSIDSVNNKISFTTPHLTDYLLGYPSRILYTAIVDDGRFFIQHRGPLTDMPTIQSYSNKVLAAAQAAEALARQREFNIPSGPGNSSVIIRIHPEPEANGHYDPLSGIIYVDDALDDTHIQTTTAHEYFHKVQDQYYAMTAANFTGLTWWYESTAPWYESLINPNITIEKIGSAGNGYLRTPLFSKKRDDSYPKSTLIEYLESRVQDFTRKTFDDNSITNSVTDSIGKFINLDSNYPHYINWALEKYGPGSGDSVIDGGLNIEESNLGIFFDQYDNNDAFVNPTPQFIDPDSTTGILSLTISDNITTKTHRAKIYRIRPSNQNSATTKTLRIRFERQNQATSNIPYVLALNASGQRVSLDALTPEATDFYRVTRFGNGAQDQVHTVYLILTEMEGIANDIFEWQIEVIEQLPLADIEIELPADSRETSEIRLLQPEQFSFPSIAVDASNDPAALGFSLSFSGVQSQPSTLALGWFATGINLFDSPVTYADPNVGFLNNNNIPGFPGFLTGLNNFDHFSITAFGCSNATQDCNSRGLSSLRYVNGAVDFSFTINPTQVTPGHTTSSPFQIIPTTPTDIQLTVSNSSSLPIVINSLDLILENTGLLGNELRAADSTPLLVVNQGEIKSATFSDISLILPNSTYGTTQKPRLLIGFDNCFSGDVNNGCGMDNTSLGTAAAFWAGTFSRSVDLQVLAPP